MALPDLLLPYQQAWLRDKAQVRVAEKSRRIGWSWVAACEAVLDASQVGGCDVWYVGYNREMAVEFIRDCAYWARFLSDIAREAGGGPFEHSVSEQVFEDDDPDKQILTYAIHFASGLRVTALSSRPTNLRGKRGRIIIDEAAFHDDLAGLLKAALAVLMWGGKARVDLISTHNGTESEFNQIVEGVRAGKYPYSLHRCTLDEALAQGLYKRICYVNRWEWSEAKEAEWRAQLMAQYQDHAEEELLCVPARSGGQYIPRDVIERQMRPGAVARLVLPEGFVNWPEAQRTQHVAQWCNAELAPLLARLPKELMHGFGEDFGRTSDRTVIAPFTIAQDLVRRFPFAVELSNVPFEAQKQILFYVVDRLPRFVKGALDATGNGAFLAEVAMQRYGEQRIERIDLTEKWYAENLPPMKAALEDGLLEVVRDADHLIDLSAFKVINGLPKLPKAKVASANTRAPPRHGDAAIAYLLGHYASRLPIVDYGYTPASKSASAQHPLRTGVRSMAEGLMINRSKKSGGLL